VTEDRPDTDRSGRPDPEREGPPGGESDDEEFRRHWEQLSDSARPPETRQAESRGILVRFRYAQSGPLLWLRMGLFIATIVVVTGAVLFAIAGTWPLVVGVESGSMEPHIAKGDLVVLTATDRFAPAAADTDIGVVTYKAGRDRGYRSFGSYGSVVVFTKPDGSGAVIHRVHFRVEAGENWVPRANDSYLSGEGCATVQHCPAPHDGFITKGDANPEYDQSGGLVPPVRAEWIDGAARARVPLG
jgi:signal peptidase